MPNLNLSKNYQIICSPKGIQIISQLQDINQNADFFHNSTISEIKEYFLSILNIKSKAELAPKFCTSHTQRKAEAFLIINLFKTIFHYYYNFKTNQAYNEICKELPSFWKIRNFSKEELAEHLEEIKNSQWYVT